MAKTSTAAKKGARRKTGARSPDVDFTRGLLLLLAVLVLVAPDRSVLPAWLAPSAWNGGSVADLLPAAFACVSGAAIAHQVRDRAGRSWAWWVGRMGRRLIVLAALGVLLAWLSGTPSLPVDWTELRWTHDLVRIGIATVIAIPLVRLPRWGEVAIATALLVAHTALTLSAGLELTPSQNGLIGLDQKLLGAGRALVPVDPDGITALAPTLVALLVGFWIGEWIDARARGAATGGVLLMLGAWAGVVAWSWHQVVPANATLWTGPIVAGGIGLALLLLGLGHLGTRLSKTDSIVATVAVLGQVTLPAYVLTVLFGRFVAGLAPMRWLVNDGLGPMITPLGATIVIALVVAFGLLRLGDRMLGSGIPTRA